MVRFFYLPCMRALKTSHAEIKTPHAEIAIAARGDCQRRTRRFLPSHMPMIYNALANAQYFA